MMPTNRPLTLGKRYPMITLGSEPTGVPRNHANWSGKALLPEKIGPRHQTRTRDLIVRDLRAGLGVTASG
jgi:hypothetical protein